LEGGFSAPQGVDSRFPIAPFHGYSPICGSQSNLVVSTEVSMKSEQVAAVLYVVAMAAVIVGVDFVFFRNRFWERLAVNIGIVLVFGAFYLRFLRRP
jgi:hypothetical protein